MVLIPIMLFATASFLASIGVTVAVSFLDTIVGGGLYACSSRDRARMKEFRTNPNVLTHHLTSFAFSTGCGSSKFLGVLQSQWNHHSLASMWRSR